MTTPVIMDIIAAVVLVTFTAYGIYQGLFRSLAGLLTVVVALVGAGMIANALTAPVTKVVTPLLRSHIESRVDDAVSAQAPQVPGVPTEAEEAENGFSAEDLLALLGLDRDVREDLAAQAQETARDTGVSIAMAVVESVAQSIIYGGLYLLSFLLLLCLLKLAIKAMDLVLRLPGLNLLNGLGGGAIGFLQGALLVFLAIWIARRLGVSFETDAVAETHLLRFFTTNTPLSALSFLK